ncbi:serine protease persephone-like [Zophobas morio]|uniref:serine protease persephone-like n=1 Tax=Zophobas morio TaxID=2755281 RepID=UPI0030829F6F
MFQTNNWVFHGLVIGFSLFHVYCQPSELYGSSKCHNSNAPGKCIPITKCTSALEEVKNYRPHGLKRCGFQEFVEIVCCPDSDDTEKSTSIRGGDVARKSQKVCDKYSKDLPLVLIYHILNGENTQPGEFPHMAALGFFNKKVNMYRFDCGGTLISPYHIVTAAHCLVNVQGNELKIARLGVINVPEMVKNPDPKIDYNVVDVIIHKHYDGRRKLNDIALVKLEKQVRFTDTIRPACLYTKNDNPENLKVTGWGVVSFGGERSSILQKGTLNPVPLQECSSIYQKRVQKEITENQICAVSNPSSACQGDSGGPLQTQSRANLFTVVGISSYGIGCGGQYPGVYTRISGYLDWIEKIVWPGTV